MAGASWKKVPFSNSEKAFFSHSTMLYLHSPKGVQAVRCVLCLGWVGGRPQSLALRVLGDRHRGYKCPRVADVTSAKFPERDLLLLTLSLSPHLLLRLALALA